MNHNPSGTRALLFTAVAVQAAVMLGCGSGSPSAMTDIERVSGGRGPASHARARDGGASTRRPMGAGESATGTQMADGMADGPAALRPGPMALSPSRRAESAMADKAGG